MPLAVLVSGRAVISHIQLKKLEKGNRIWVPELLGAGSFPGLYIHPLAFAFLPLLGSVHYKEVSVFQRSLPKQILVR